MGLCGGFVGQVEGLRIVLFGKFDDLFAGDFIAPESGGGANFQILEMDQFLGHRFPFFSPPRRGGAGGAWPSGLASTQAWNPHPNPSPPGQGYRRQCPKEIRMNTV